MTKQKTEDAIAALRAAYEAFNRGEIHQATRVLDDNVEWIEPLAFPGGGTYHGVEGARRYLSRSRASAARVIGQPERFIPADDRIIVFVHARVLPNASAPWQDVRLADVYRFQGGKAVQMRAFADRREALRWVGFDESSIHLIEDRDARTADGK